MRKIFFLCDGEKEDCHKTHCYKQKEEKDPCRHTTDINHAMNYEKMRGDEVEAFWEKETALVSQCSKKRHSERQKV